MNQTHLLPHRDAPAQVSRRLSPAHAHTFCPSLNGEKGESRRSGICSSVSRRERSAPLPAAEREHSGVLEPHTGEVCPPATYHIGVIEDIARSLIIAPASRLSDVLLCPGAGMPPGSARFRQPPHADYVTPAPGGGGFRGGQNIWANTTSAASGCPSLRL